MRKKVSSFHETVNSKFLAFLIVCSQNALKDKNLDFLTLGYFKHSEGQGHATGMISMPRHKVNSRYNYTKVPIDVLILVESRIRA
jgi:hypothetical protein